MNENATNCNPDEEDVSFRLNLDPSTLSTAQQKVIAFRQRRIIVNPRVARAMKTVRFAVTPFVEETRTSVDRWLSEGRGIGLSITFLFSYPKGGTKREKAARREGSPVLSAKWGDLDNRAKAFIDALVKAGMLPDDHLISNLSLRKRYTLSKPSILISFFPD